MRIYESAQMLQLMGPHVRQTEVIEIDTPAGVIRMNTSAWDLQFVEGTSFGGGSAIKVEFPTEDMSLASHPCKLTLSSLNPSVTALALSTPMANRRMRIYHGIFDDNYQLLPNMKLTWSGWISHLDLINLSSNDTN